MILLRQTYLILKKEWWDLMDTFFSFSNFQLGLYPILFFTAAFGVYEPYKIGPTWISSPIMLFSFIVILPLVTISFISPNSIVGERILKTLEPLLATPVYDLSILLGKTGLAVIYGWGTSLANMLIGLVVVNLLNSTSELLFYPSNLLLLMVFGSLLFSIFISVAGINFSLYSATLLEAQNKLGILIFVPLVIPAFILGPLLPKNLGFLFTIINEQLVSQTNLIGLYIFLIIDVLLFIFVLIRFNREKLLLGEFYSN